MGIRKRGQSVVLLAPPPRRVPPSLAVRLVFGGPVRELVWLGFGLSSSLALAFLRHAGRARFGVEAALVALFPLAGTILVGVMTWRGLRRVRLLRRGQVALGKLIAQEPTGATVDGIAVVRLRFEIRTESAGAHEVRVELPLAERLEDDARERLLYDPARPREAIAWDLRPDGPRIDEGGQLAPPRGIGSVLMLLPPALAVLAHIVALAL